MSTRVNSIETTYRAYNQNLEIKMGKLAQAINQRLKGTLSSDIEMNPKRPDQERCNAIMLRSGTILGTNLDNHKKRKEELEQEDSKKEKVNDEVNPPKKVRKI